ncbi:hypothetical protein [Rhodopirellula bahusiensis]|uniref:Uncharacterized protein n=1 Tax=Rhodopirellula bahusiensis TaxID=2014065 RepID=A0A2G1W707_9BACT|nr:hypothetical protein [Rhodopirellula bahusiensis]PHQ34791.1 hypothetical protein CEE69_13020 [Rhodopirellula bahusiensis]
MTDQQASETHMEFNCWKKSYNSFGGSSLFSPIAGLLTVKLADSSYGDAVQEIDITANLRSRTGKPRRTLENLFKQFHEFIETLPLVTFRRKKQKLEIQFLSEHFSDQDDIHSNASPDNLHSAAQEVATALILVRKRVKKSDNFDVDRFLADATSLLESKIETEDEWNRIKEQAKAIDEAVMAMKSPWELLEIEGTSSIRKLVKYSTSRFTGSVPTTLPRTAMTRERTCLKTSGDGTNDPPKLRH